MMKIDKYHYHEFIHTVNMFNEMIENHLLNHHIGINYSAELNHIQNKLCELYSTVSNDSDKLFSNKTTWQPISELKETDTLHWFADSDNNTAEGYLSCYSGKISILERTGDKFGKPVMFAEIKPPAI